jgi:DMSO/TMAO reductase YedYZ heme-binding membrane subunit
MGTGLLHLHNLLRWVILILLLISIFQAFTKKESIAKISLFLMISAHITLLLGLYQYFTSEVAGFKMIERLGGMGAVMKDSFARFWVVEHISTMLIAIILITIGRRKAKALQYRPALILFLIAFLLIMAGVPWPFREAIARPLFPGMS